MDKATRETLYEMGITSRYKGHWYISYSIRIVDENDDFLHQTVTELYDEVARHFNVSAFSIEYDIRTAIIVAWKTNPDMLEKICKVKLYKPPSNKEFLENMAAFVRKRVCQRK